MQEAGERRGSETLVIRNDDWAEPHKYDPWWSNRFESDISGPGWGSDERTRAPIIHLINFAVTDASRLVNYSGYHSGAGIFLVTYFCVHWSGHQGSGSNLAQLRLGSAESGDSRGLQGTPDFRTRGIGDQIRGLSLRSCMNSRDNITGYSVIWFPEWNEMLISL